VVIIKENKIKKSKMKMRKKHPGRESYMYLAEKKRSNGEEKGREGEEITYIEGLFLRSPARSSLPAVYVSADGCERAWIHVGGAMGAAG
jgi:hypothetical protein